MELDSVDVNLVSFKYIPLFISCLVVDTSSIKSLDFLNVVELCELVEDREGLMKGERTSRY